jgi:D-alanine-D-alanine ligase
MKTIALIAGGTSAEREISFKSAESVRNHLDKKKYTVVDYDPATDLEKLVHDKDHIDFAMIMLHGRGGEDGTIQGLLELLEIPYNGSGVQSSANAIHKPTAKLLYTMAGLPVAKDMMIRQDDHYTVDHMIEKLGLPVVVKPVNEGSSKGMSIPKTKEDLADALEKAFQFDHEVLLEEYIQGTEITAPIVGNESPESLPLIEIVPAPLYEFFDYEAKYKPGASEEICPARLNEQMTRKCQELGIRAHQVLGCSGYSRTDMMVRGEDVFLLETNTIPGMTTGSLFPKAAKAAGMSLTTLLDRLIELGNERFIKQYKHR